MDNKLLLQRIAKCAVGWNQKEKGYTEFDKKFLELYDNFNLIIEDCGDSVKCRVTTKK